MQHLLMQHHVVHAGAGTVVAPQQGTGMDLARLGLLGCS